MLFWRGLLAFSLGSGSGTGDRLIDPVLVGIDANVSASGSAPPVPPRGHAGEEENAIRSQDVCRSAAVPRARVESAAAGLELLVVKAAQGDGRLELDADVPLIGLAETRDDERSRAGDLGRRGALATP